jgi:hypothetical protein
LRKLVAQPAQLAQIGWSGAAITARASRRERAICAKSAWREALDSVAHRLLKARRSDIALLEPEIESGASHRWTAGRQEE